MESGEVCLHFMRRDSQTRGERIHLRSFVCISSVILFCSVDAASQGPGNRQGSLHAQLTRGYDAISQNPAEAVLIFEEIVREFPASVAPRRQLGSLYIGAGRTAEALDQFVVADSLFPSDTTKLQIAFLLASLSRYEDAGAVFRSLEGSPDRGIGERSAAAVAVLGWAVKEDAHPWWGRICGDPYYDGRFSNGVFRFWVMGGRYLTEGRTVSAYGVGLFTRDTRSSGGAVPIIYSDSYSLVGGGLRVQPFSGARLDVQAGVAIGLIDRPGESDERGDFRALASYGWGRYPEPESPDGLQVRFKPFVEAMAMGGYYSRYENVIGFGHAKGGVRLLEWSRSYGEMYFRTDMVADTRRDFFNNILEVSAGIRIVPDFGLGVQVLAEYHRGLYWDRSLPSAPYDRWYSSGRLIISLDLPFAM